MKNIDNLRAWLVNHFKTDAFSLTPIPGDASFRCYFRIQHKDQSFIAMDAPPPLEDVRPFIAIAKKFAAQQVQVPEILAAHLEEGFLLLTDFGDRLFLKELQLSNADQLYTAALTTLLQIQTCDPNDIPHFDRAFMQKELSAFQEWFLEKHLNVNLPASLLQHTFEYLIDSAEQQPQVCVHRDYHSRNLMCLNNGEVGVLDFQDAVLGPITYDAVSLLRDCYIDWPSKQVEAWADNFRQQACKQVSSAQFLQWFDLMGIQRHLKALFIFARKYIRDNDPNYLADIPRTLQYVIDVSERYPALREFRQVCVAWGQKLLYNNKN